MKADDDHRRAARLRLDCNVVVEAGAGTGKTTLLTDRLLFLLLGSRPAPSLSSIVALTFTEKAAGEIKLRLTERLSALAAWLSGGEIGAKERELLEPVRRELAELFGADDAEVLARARRALEDMDRAAIGTIHSFAAQILRLYPLEAGVDPGFSVDEGQAFEELFEAEWARWLDSELGEEPPREREWLELLRWAPLEDLEELARALASERLDLGAVGEPDAGAARWARDAAEALRRAAEGQPEPGRASKIRPAVAEILARLEALAAAAESSAPALAAPSASSFGSSWPKAWDPAGAALYERARELAERSSAGAEALTRRAARLLRPFAERFRALYARRGFVSFDGLLRRARDLVRDRPEARAELKARFRAILVDEFQDTDPLQGELLLFLAETPEGAARRWQDVRLAPGRLFVVGDPKQSIYRFRGADIAAYQSFTAHVLSQPGALACDLKSNFRSTPALIEPVNAVFAPLLRHAPGLQAEYKALVPAAADAPGPALELVHLEPDDRDAKLSAEQGQTAEALWIASWIGEHCGEGRPYRLRDAAVLLRTSAPLGALLDAFKAAGIPYAVDLEKRFYGAQEVLDLLNLLRCLEDPGDREAFAGILRSPLGGLDDAALYALAREGRLSYSAEPSASLPAEDRRRLGRLYAALRSLRERVGRLPLGELVAAALRETPLLALSARAYHGAQTVSNLTKFARLAAEASDGRGATLREFIERVAAEMERPRGEGESPLADEHLEAVRVMSVHKAKGLEFPVVFLANAAGARGSGAKATALVDWSSGRVGLRLAGCGAASAAMARLELEEEERQRHEAARLLYVALTRAKRRLFVLGRAGGDRGSFAALLSAAGAWPQDGENSLRLGGREVPVRRPRAGELPRPRPPAAAAAAALPAPERLGGVWEGRARRRDQAREKPWRRSATAYLAESAPPPGSAAVGGGRLLGQLCHRVLQNWDWRASGGVEQAIARARAALERAEPREPWSEIAAEARGVLERFFASAAARRLAAAEIVGRELPFAYEEDGVLVRGALDLLLREGERLVVVDFKTDAVDPAGAARQREKYAAQGECYRAAVSRALGAAPERVEFRLVFLRAPELSA